MANELTSFFVVGGRCPQFYFTHAVYYPHPYFVSIVLFIETVHTLLYVFHHPSKYQVGVVYITNGQIAIPVTL